MAVRKGDQEPGKLRVLEASKVLLKYTYDRVRDKTFPKAERWIIAKRIWDEAVEAHIKIIRANGIRIESKEDAEKRVSLEKEVVGHLDALISLIDLANVSETISDDRTRYWVGLATETQNFAKGWLKRDRGVLINYDSNAS